MNNQTKRCVVANINQLNGRATRTVGQIIKAGRVKAGWSSPYCDAKMRDAFAESCGVSKTYLRNIELGINDDGKLMPLKLVCDRLGLKLWELLKEADY
jgi:transcriptional regulator with XRE-family HTH domain